MARWNPLPMPSVSSFSELPWQVRGACIGRFDLNFFPDVGINAMAEKELCSRCPVMRECKEHGIAHEKFGIWGGTSEQERKFIRRERKRHAASKGRY